MRRGRAGAGAPRAAVAALVVVLGVLLAGCATAPAGAGEGRRYVSGDGGVTTLAPSARKPAPEVSGKTLEGSPVSLASKRGSVVVLNVWGSWCPPCRAEAPALERVSSSTRSQGVEFLGIAVRETSTDAPLAFQRRFALSYPSIYDPDSSLLLDFRDTLPANAIPSTLVIDRQGRVAARVLGGVTEDRLRALLATIVAEPA